MSDANTPIGRVAKYVKEEIPEQVAKAIAEIEVPAGEAGADGADGLGFNLKSWENKIHREGSVVQHFIGQAYKALVDTNDEPGDSSDWERVGSNGFRWTGVKKADHDYQDGDLYIDGGTTFMWQGGKGYMFAQRGKNGKDGSDGKAGKDGADANNIIDLTIVGKDLVAVFEDGTMHATAMPVLDEIGDVKKQLTWLEQQMLEFENIKAPIKGYEGLWEHGKNYSKGDVVNFSKGLYLCFKADSNSTGLDPEKWVKIAGMGGGGGGGGGSTGGSLKAVPDPGRNWVWAYTAGNPNLSGDWTNFDGRYVDVITSLNDLFHLRGRALQAGRPYFVKNQNGLYGFIGDPTHPSGDITDWQLLTGSSGSIIVNRASDLPQPTVSRQIPNGSLAVVRNHLDGVTPYWRLFSATTRRDGGVTWHAVQQVIGDKALRGDADQPEATHGDLQVTTENGHKEVKMWDNVTGAWILIYSEDNVKGWIAAGNLFVGTSQDVGHGTAGAINIDTMPTQASLGATDKGHYWTWVGAAGYVLGANAIGGATSAIEGQRLNVGDWIQVAEPIPGVYQYVVIPGDLLAKSRGDSLYGLSPWATGAYEQGSLVVFQGKIYKSSSPILLTDPNPTDPGNTKWQAINLASGVAHVLTDANLPATGAVGDVYFVTSSGHNGGKPSFLTYDAGAANWTLIGGGGDVPLDLSGGTVVYPNIMNYSGDRTAAKPTGLVVNDLLSYPLRPGDYHSQYDMDRWDGSNWQPAVRNYWRRAWINNPFRNGTNDIDCDMSRNTYPHSNGVTSMAVVEGMFVTPDNTTPIVRFRVNDLPTPHRFSASDDVRQVWWNASYGNSGDNSGNNYTTTFSRANYHYILTKSSDGNFKPIGNQTTSGKAQPGIYIRSVLTVNGSDHVCRTEISYQSKNLTPFNVVSYFRWVTSHKITGLSLGAINTSNNPVSGTYGNLEFKWR